MVKYFNTILLLAVAAFWSSVVARPQYDFSYEINDPEYELQDVKHKPWKSVDEYLVTEESELYEILDGNFDNEISRRKREIDSDKTNEIVEDDKVYYEAYVRVLLVAAPPAYKSILRQIYDEALEKNYENYDDFMEKANDIFGEVTGIDLGKFMATKEGNSEDEFSRKKRLVDFDQSNEEKSINSQFFYNFYANLLAYTAPSNAVTLKQRLVEAMRNNYDSFHDFNVEAVRIFSEVTRLNIQSYGKENSRHFYVLYAHLLAHAAPSYQVATMVLKRISDKDRRSKYNSFSDFQADATRIFEEVTGISIEQRSKELDRLFEPEV